MAFKYRPRTKESVDKRVASSGSLYDSFIKPGTPLFKMIMGGSHTIRILPPTWIEWPEKTKESNQRYAHYGLDIYYHDKVGVDNGSFICYESMDKYCSNEFGMSFQAFLKRNGINFKVPASCPICWERRRADDEGDEEYAYSLKAKRKVLVWLIDRDNEKDGPLVWALPGFKIDSEIVSRTGGEGEVLLVDDVIEGYDIKFSSDKTKTKDGTFPTYKGVNVVRHPSQLSEDDDQREEWLEFITQNPIPTIINLVATSYIEKVRSGEVSKKEKEDTTSIDTISETDETEPEEETNEQATTEIDLNNLSRTELKQYIKDNNFDIKVMKSMSDDDIREKILEIVSLEQEESEEQEQEEENTEEVVEEVKPKSRKTDSTKATIADLKKRFTNKNK